MITFKKFLTEKDSHRVLYNDTNWTQAAIRDSVMMIKRDCGPYLREIKDPTKVRAYRGIQLDTRPHPVFLKKDVRTDRHPKDTPEGISKLMDNWFKKKFGIKFRSESMFVTSRAWTAAAYGLVYMVFPIGDYDYVWSKKYSDLTEDAFTAVTQKAKDNPEELKYLNVTHSNLKQKHLDEVMEDGDYKFNKGLVEALTQSKSEVMIKCKSYYALDTRWKDIYLDVLTGLV